MAWPSTHLPGTSLAAQGMPAVANCTARRGLKNEKARERKSGIGNENALVNPKAVHCVDVAELPCTYAC